MKIATMDHLSTKPGPQVLRVGFGVLRQAYQALFDENHIQVVFERDFPGVHAQGTPPPKEVIQAERTFHVAPRYTKGPPEGVSFIGHARMENGQEYNIFTEDFKEFPMKTVHRDYLAITPAVQTKHIGQGALLHAAEDRQGLGRIDIWYEVDTDLQSRVLVRNFVIIKTGETLTLPGYTYFTTVVMQNGQIFHIYAQYGF